MTSAAWFNALNDLYYTTLAGVVDTGVLTKVAFPAVQVASAGANDLDDYEEGSYTGTFVGVSGGPVTGTVNYTKIGNVVILDAPSFTGTSNGASKTVTGAPATIRPTTNKKFSCFSSDNGGAYVAAIGDLATDGTLEYFTTANGSVWTTSGTASVQKLCFTYTLN